MHSFAQHTSFSFSNAANDGHEDHGIVHHTWIDNVISWDLLKLQSVNCGCSATDWGEYVCIARKLF